MEWIPIKKEPPYTNGEFLVTFCFGEARLVDIMVYEKKNKKFLWDQSFTRDMTDFVTAWMPVPLAYKE